METTNGSDAPVKDAALMESGRRYLVVFVVLGVSAITLYLLETMIRPVDGELSSLEWIIGFQYMVLYVMGERRMPATISRLIVSEAIYSILTVFVFYAFDAWL
jgi:hypothetical protein